MRRIRPGAAVSLPDVVITEQLAVRPSRPPDLGAENRALLALARQLANHPERMLDALVAAALELCDAGTAGVSMLATDERTGERVFRWDALAGELATFVGGTTPRGFSPCGVTLDRGTPQLFDRPGRYFTYFQACSPAIVEGLVVPFGPPAEPLGTIWVVSHRDDRRFDWEDARVMTSLAHFTAAALRLSSTAAENARLAAQTTALAERFGALLRSFPAGSVNIFDRDLRYVLAEGAGLARIGVPPGQLVGRTLAELFPSDQVDLVRPHYERAFAGEVVAFDLPLGDAGTWAIVAAPLPGPDGQIREVMAIAHDVSERVRLHAAEQRAHAELEAAVKVRDALVAAITHDLKNPLAAVRGYAQLVRRRIAAGSAPVEWLAEVATRLEDTASRAVDMLDDLIEVGQGRQGAPGQLDRTRVDLVGLAHETLDAHARTADRHALRLDAPADPLIGRWDARALRRILDNLLANAIKYSPTGGEVLVRVAAEEGPDGPWALVTVRDWGIGIPPDDLAHVFEPFWRGEATAASIPGIGVGLASVRQLVEQHGGTVAVASTPGAGSTFTVRLPVGSIT